MCKWPPTTVLTPLWRLYYLYKRINASKLTNILYRRSKLKNYYKKPNSFGKRIDNLIKPDFTLESNRREINREK